MVVNITVPDLLETCPPDVPVKSDSTFLSALYIFSHLLLNIFSSVSLYTQMHITNTWIYYLFPFAGLDALFVFCIFVIYFNTT